MTTHVSKWSNISKSSSLLCRAKRGARESSICLHFTRSIRQHLTSEFSGIYYSYHTLPIELSLDKTATAKTNGAFLFSMFATLDLWPLVQAVFSKMSIKMDILEKTACRISGCARALKSFRILKCSYSFDSALLLVCVMN